MIDTQEIGAGSYPSVLEEDIKQYEIETEISAKMRVVVYAKNREEAVKFAKEGQNDDINDIKNITIENVVEVKEVTE